LFNEELFYFFYGGLFYCPLNKSTRNASELPIAFIFDPKVLIHMLRYYPFGTGAAFKRRFGTCSMQLKDFSIDIRYSAVERLEEAKNTGAEALITARPWCKRNFTDAIKESGDRVKVYDIVELLEQAI
jgi:hypothetical protein